MRRAAVELMDAAQVLPELCLADAAFQAVEDVLKGHRFIKRLTHGRPPGGWGLDMSR